jgi:hypothetical protein
MNKGELRQNQDNRSKAIYEATKSRPEIEVLPWKAYPTS